jgi:hypothetical protein
MRQPQRIFRFIAALVAVLMIAPSAPFTWAASHREAPLIALDPTADITDVYAFRSWEDPTKAVFIMNVIPSQVPASGPNFFNFDDDVLYAFHFDMNADGKPDDVTVEFRFTTEIRPPFDDLPVAYAGPRRRQLRRAGIATTIQRACRAVYWTRVFRHLHRQQRQTAHRRAIKCRQPDDAELSCAGGSGGLQSRRGHPSLRWPA